MNKYSDNFMRDYTFYTDNIDTFSFSGVPISELQRLTPNIGTNSVIKTFHRFDSQGKLLGCEDPELFVRLIETKKAVNFWIKYWAEGFSDLMEPLPYYTDVFVGEVPDWLIVSFRKQIEKYHGSHPSDILYKSMKEIGVL